MLSASDPHLPGSARELLKKTRRFPRAQALNVRNNVSPSIAPVLTRR